MEKKLLEGWEWKKLGEIGELISGVTYKSNEALDEPKENYIPILRANNINGEINFGSLVYVPSSCVKEKQLIEENDILIAMSSGSKNIVGKTAQAKTDFFGSFGAFCGLFRCKNGTNKKYVGYYFKTPWYRNKISSLSRGANINNLRKENITSLNIPIPPLKTQQKIVAILEKADETKKLRAQADELTQKLLQSVFLEMFGDPVENSRGWKSHKLEELGNWTSGGTPSRSKPEYFQGEIPWFTTGELNDSYICDSKEKITKEALNSSSARLFPAGTLLIGMYDTAAFKMGILKNPASSNQACAAFSPKVGVIDTLFALYLFKEMKDSFLSQRRGIRQKNLSQSIIKKFEVPIPPIELQQQFAGMVQKIDQIKESQKQSSLETNNLFDALMQKAFTGELVS